MLALWGSQSQYLEAGAAVSRPHPILPETGLLFPFSNGSVGFLTPRHRAAM